MLIWWTWGTHLCNILHNLALDLRSYFATLTDSAKVNWLRLIKSYKKTLRTKRNVPKVVTMTEEQLMVIASQPIKRSKRQLNRPSLL